MNVKQETLDLVQVMIDIVRSEQVMRMDLQNRIARLEMKRLADDVIVEIPRLQAAISAAKEN